MLKIIKYQLYLLQLENYEILRYFTLLWKKGIFPPKHLRGKLVWTSKAKLVLALTIIIHLVGVKLLTLEVYLATKNIWLTALAYIIFLVILSFFHFIFHAISVSIIHPFQHRIKRKMMARARTKIKSLPNLKVLGIAGSYGKTSMKEALRSSLSECFKVAATPESINTPIGVAKFIISEINEWTQILIIEMGEHYKGDVKELCSIAKPDIGVITGINESHLERFHDLKTSIGTIFELAEEVKEGGMVVLNADDEYIRENHARFTQDKRIFFYSSYNYRLSHYQTADYHISIEDLTSNFQLCEEGKVLAKVKSKILGEYIRGMAVASELIAKELGEPISKMVLGLEKMQPVPHRLEPIINPNGLLVIDDSYNGNPDGVREAIKLLSGFKDRRRVYLTPGLVEMGDKAQEVHEKIGQQLAKNVDLVLLVRNSVTPFIEKGLMKNGFANDKIIWYDTAQEAHKSLDKVLHKGDVILFQNDWGDQYL